MKKVLLAAAAIALSAGGAQAEGWSGIYFGIQVTGASADIEHPFSAAHGGALTGVQSPFEVSGLGAGVHAGYDKQLDFLGWDCILVGVGVSYTAMNANDYDNGTINAAVNPLLASVEQNQASVDAYKDAFVRLGMLVLPGTLVYGKFGYAAMDSDYIAASTPVVEKGGYYDGTVIGAGAEFKMGGQFNLGFEWKKYELDSSRLNMAPRAYDVGVEPDLQSFEIRLSYKLNEFF